WKLTTSRAWDNEAGREPWTDLQAAMHEPGCRPWWRVGPVKNEPNTLFPLPEAPLRLPPAIALQSKVATQPPRRRAGLSTSSLAVSFLAEQGKGFPRRGEHVFLPRCERIYRNYTFILAWRHLYNKSET